MTAAKNVLKMKTNEPPAANAGIDFLQQEKADYSHQFNLFCISILSVQRLWSLWTLKTPFAFSVQTESVEGLMVRWMCI